MNTNNDQAPLPQNAVISRFVSVKLSRNSRRDDFYL
jgi:hypothetical protein